MFKEEVLVNDFFGSLYLVQEGMLLKKLLYVSFSIQ
jgi:hypothetical protein